MALGKRTLPVSGDGAQPASHLYLLRSALPAFLFLIATSSAVFTGGCSTTQAPVVSRSSGEITRPGVSSSSQPRVSRSQSTSGVHTVQKGDTLYSIAWRYGLDYRRLADWNNISEPYVIYPGQGIRLKPSPGRRSRTAASRSNAGSTGTAQQSTSASSETHTRSSSSSAAIKWEWPTPGELVKLDTPIAKKGVNISGRKGQSVQAAASGHVVYSGSGLLGYGKLIIIKHSDVYLSAYAHNDEIYVKEGDRVAVGQKIATMGLGNDGKPVLHFEIRKDGKPVSPLYHLPKNRS